MALSIAGLIEGFYGTPWSWDARAHVLRWCHERGMTHYVYAPKDDPKHRERWRDSYDEDDQAGFARLVDEGTLDIGFAISPGLSIDYHAADDRDALAAKVDHVMEVGVTTIVLALDDIPFRDGLGDDHVAITSWLREHIGDRGALHLVPTEYVGVRATPYLDALAAGVPDDVLIGWTGQAVVVDEITAADARARADSLGGRRALLWDNYPVNDGPMADQLFIGPLRGRTPALTDELGGYLANVGLEPMANTLPLASIAGWLRDGDSDSAWHRDADALGWRSFAEACDGGVPRALVAEVIDRGDTTAARQWFATAVDAAAPGLEVECERWLDQVRYEAKVAMMALDLLDGTSAPGGLDAVGPALGMLVRWKRLQSAPVQVMGPRMGIRPGIGQAPDGSWRVETGALSRNLNAVDALCAHAFDVVTSQ